MTGEFKVLDLFSGIGGLSHGFSNNGFNVTGVDRSERTGLVYQIFASPNFIHADLGYELISGEYDVVVGGPPCRPWSPVNLYRRSEVHRDYRLVERFVKHVENIRPRVFIMENVPALRSDKGFGIQMDRISKLGYSVETTFVKYSDYGAPTSRKRLIAVGLLDGPADQFVDGLKKFTKPPKLLKDTIGEYRYNEMGNPEDHVWPNLKTISKYAEKYRTGKYGWRILDWNSPAPSFGNVMKTYILPPDSDPMSPDARVVSVLEVSRIMGFNHGF
ncbi:MAG: DNA cytosine methyltransferase, partial [Thermoplasmataceae archaeon]